MINAPLLKNIIKLPGSQFERSRVFICDCSLCIIPHHHDDVVAHAKQDYRR